MIDRKSYARNVKLRLINAFGGKCSICDYSTCVGALDFHHRNPNKKDDNICSLIRKGYSWHKIVEEAKKCLLVCSNCHREIHYSNKDVSKIKQTINYDIVNYKEISIENCFDFCSMCGCRKKKIRKYCSNKCSHDANKKIKISKKKLIQLSNKHSNVQLGKMFNVSEAAIRKKLKYS